MPRPTPPSTSGAKEGFWVHHEGLVQGPFDRDFIDAMILADVYPANVRVVKDGDSGRQSPSVSNTITTSIERSTKARVVTNDDRTPPSKPRQPLSRDAKWTMAVAIVGSAFMLWVVHHLYSPRPSQSSQIAAASSTTPQSHSPTARPTTYSSYSSPAKPQSASPPVAYDAAASSRYPNNTLPPPRPRAITRASTNPGGSVGNAESSPLTRPLSVSNPAGRQSSPMAASRPSSEDSQLYRDESGRVYRVPNSAYYRLQAMSSALGIKKRNLDREESELKFLAEELDRDRRYLDRSSQYEVDRFNGKVNRLNSMNDALQSLVDDYNRDVNAFNAELERVGTPIR
jgi:hypothetical protein